MKEIRLKKGKVMLNGKLYIAGDVLPNSPTARRLLKDRKAESVEVETEENSETEPAKKYSDMTVKELSAIAESHDLEIPKGAAKADIVTLLETWDAANGGVS